MNPEQYEAITRRWYEPLYRFAYSLCGNPDDALDLAQSAFFKLSTKGHTLKDKSKVKTWLFSVVHREFIDQYRRRTRFPHSDLDEVTGLATTAPPPNARKLDARQALTALHELDELHRAPLVLFYLEELSYREIADTLAIPIGTVMSRLRRGKDRLREHLEKAPAKEDAPVIHFRKARHG